MSEHLGMGVLIGLLSGNEDSVNAFKPAIGKKIKELTLGKEDNALHFVFEDGYKMRLFDDGQSCCESRYMRTDDNLKDYIGAKLVSAETAPAPNIPDEYDEHEVAFLHVRTDKGTFTMQTHNEHNGYYGGFSVVCALDELGSGVTMSQTPTEPPQPKETKIILADTLADQRENGTEEKPLHRYAVAVLFTKQWKDDKGEGQVDWRLGIIKVDSEDQPGAEWLGERQMRRDSQLPSEYVLNMSVSTQLD